MIDIKFDTYDGTFRLKSFIIMKNDGKILLDKTKDNIFYCLPGGFIELGDSSKDYAKKEAKKILGVDVKVEKLVAVHENFFQREDLKVLQELAFYYLCTPLEPEKLKKHNFSLYESDKGEFIKHQLFWTDEESLKNLDFRPLAVRDILFKDLSETEVIISRDKFQSICDKY